MHDIVISGGLVVDGTGAPPVQADIAVDAGKVTAVGEVAAESREVIDASGLVVMPGFVDIHCHYDGQATWDPLLEPSSLHGVTTVIVGNCGVGFAPVEPDRHQWLIELMEGVEDIPGSALEEGITWGWESFPQYLDVLDAIPRAIDLGTQLPHGALRGYVMGDRGAANEPATVDDMDQMGRLAAEAMEAGGLGFSTNRLEGHRSKSGVPVPGTYAEEAELAAIIGAMGSGSVEWVPNGGLGNNNASFDGQYQMMRRLCEINDRPTIFLVNQIHNQPERWRRDLAAVTEMVDRGLPAFPQVHGRGFCLLFGFDTTFHPFRYGGSWPALAALPYQQRLNQLRRPDVRERVIAEAIAIGDPTHGLLNYEMVFSMGDPPDYEPSKDQSMAAIAERDGRPVLEVIYDRMLENDGQNLLSLQIINYADFSLEPMREMLEHPLTVLGGSDGGAHCATASDASMPSFMLTHWVRDRPAGRLPLELVVKKMSSATAAVYGLSDRGVLAPGKRADINVVDLDHLRLHLPEIRYDLPAGGKRLVQQADGWVATMVAGQVIRRHGTDTGARPGRLIRGGANQD
ncbi:MAG TPA: amidohydrolase family protein [Acidimicrobiales bacterium]|nr:amidohydrolase family protein [Acidimicrobiales bacterium]